jgi:hypothetical protein
MASFSVLLTRANRSGSGRVEGEMAAIDNVNLR